MDDYLSKNLFNVLEDDFYTSSDSLLKKKYRGDKRIWNNKKRDRLFVELLNFFNIDTNFQHLKLLDLSLVPKFLLLEDFQDYYEPPLLSKNDIASINQLINKYKYKDIINYLNSYVEKNITGKEKNRANNLLFYFNSLVNAKTQDKFSFLQSIIPYTEMIGDIILAIINKDIREIIENKLKESSSPRKNRCLGLLLNFLNSNLLFYHIITKIPNFNIDDLYDLRYLPSALGDRTTKHLNTPVSSNCFDYKYTSNLFEQLIGYLYLVSNNFNYVKLIYIKALDKIGFKYEKFIQRCLKDKKYYSDILLSPGCSCKDNSSVALCDNPSPYKPDIFKNLPCPENCLFGLQKAMLVSKINFFNIFQHLNKVEQELLSEEINSLPMDKYIELYYPNHIHIIASILSDTNLRSIIRDKHKYYKNLLKQGFAEDSLLFENYSEYSQNDLYDLLDRLKFYMKLKLEDLKEIENNQNTNITDVLNKEKDRLNSNLILADTIILDIKSNLKRKKRQPKVLKRKDKKSKK